ncbi:cytochrome P450 [Sorangium sp. So ce291]|uniref:cytochrome P450 n=1 Tax=Sorangium sp. So ce291 TaxID=3133294 RepID=UPI003F6004BC
MPNVLSRGLFNLFFGGRRDALRGTLPGPEPGVLGTIGDFIGVQPWQVCARYGREYGGVTLVWLGGSPALVLNDPKLIEQVLITRRTEFEKGALVEQLRPIVTDHSVVIANQSGSWPRMRRAEPFEQPWAEDWFGAQVGPMQASVAKSVRALIAQSGKSFDLVPALQRLAFDTFAVAAVGEWIPDALFEDFMLLGRAANERMLATLPLSLVRLPRGFEAAKARFYGYFLERVAAERRAPRPDAGDLLARTLREAPGIDDTVLAHVLGLIFFGGVFSTATVLLCAFQQLQKHPDAESRLHAEAAALARGELTFARFLDAHWAEAVAYESMRLLPAVRLLVRKTVKETELAGVTLPAGTMIMIASELLHRDPAHWTDPDTFEPARWLNGGVARDPLGSDYFFPYGRGPRECLGGRFATVYMTTALATIAAHAKVRLDSTEPFEEGFCWGVVLPKGVTGRFVAH